MNYTQQRGMKRAEVQQAKELSDVLTGWVFLCAEG
jgi:hypothetical protein